MFKNTFLYNKILFLFKSSNSSLRSHQVKKNIIISLFIKGANIVTGFLMVPLVLHYIDNFQYGIWITLSSIIGWFGFFDIGLGHGLRNKFTEAVAKGDKALAKIYVSTTYAALAIASTMLFVFFLLINKHINWLAVLNIKDSLSIGSDDLSILCLIVFSTFCFSFVLRLITTVLAANQESGKASVFDFLGSLVNLVSVYVLTKTTSGSLITLVVVLSTSSILILITSSLWFYNTKYKEFAPSFKHIDVKKIHDLFGLGLNFFILQIAVLLLYQTNNIIIANLFGPAEVTTYSIVYRYFNYILMIFTIVLAPLWSAFTEAWHKNDINWVLKVVKRLKQIYFLFVAMGLGMLAVSNPFFKIWLGSKIEIPFLLSAFVLLYILINLWGSIFSTFMNGVSRVRLQVIVGVSSSILNVPLAIYLGNKFGVQGIIMANILVSLPGVILYPIYVGRILEKRRIEIG